MRYANSDPVTGQAAWYDLRVRIEKAAGEAGVERAAVRRRCRRRRGLPRAPATCCATASRSGAASEAA